MKDRGLILGAGIVAIWLVFILLVPKPNLLEPVLSWPLTIDRGKQGLRGLYLWLQQADIPVISLRNRYDNLLDDKRVKKSGNLLVISLPQRIPAREYEHKALERWVNHGNSLLIMAAIGDQPEWSRQSQVSEINRFLKTFNVSFVISSEQTDDKEIVVEKNVEGVESETLNLVANSNHPVLSGISMVSIDNLRDRDQHWTLQKGCNCSLILKLLNEQQKDQPAFWGFRSGTGHIWISRFADLFGNVSLGKGDNARLIANVTSFSLEGGGTIIFDDMHMGLSDLYDPDAFYHDPRLHNTIWFIVAFWLIYILGFSNRFGPLREIKKTRRMSDLVRATGGLFARRVNKNEIARRLIGHFQNEVRSSLSLTHTRVPLWTVLQQRPKVSSRTVQQLQNIEKRLETGAKTDLVQLTRIIHNLRESIH